MLHSQKLKFCQTIESLEAERETGDAADRQENRFELLVHLRV
jgi:hypothetical protein